MKKVLVSFLVLIGLFLLTPVAFASEKAVISTTPDSEVTNSDGTVTKTYSVYIETTAGEKLDTAELGFQYGTAITTFTCAGANDYSVTQEATGQNSATCKWALPEGSEGKSGERILLGTIKAVVNKDAKDEDCTIQYAFKGATGKVNPETGVAVPYVIIGSGVLLAAGLFIVTRRRTKLYKI